MTETCRVVVDHLCNDRDVCEDIRCGHVMPCKKHSAASPAAASAPVGGRSQDEQERR